MTMNPDRRPLQYENLDAIMPDVERLLAGHSTVGSWTLGQICEHLATVTKRAVDLPASTQHDPSSRLSDEQKRQVFATGQLPEGMPLPLMLKTPDAVDASEGAKQLREVLAYYQGSPGPVAPHRLFGPLTKGEWDRLVCIHCAHHLSFAIPQAG